ncbi:MAG: hypothetical protein GEV03_21575 [Streptosporangiales bacterium]|nr:hypothetical protein [Streptosporangiales bacterium]
MQFTVASAPEPVAMGWDDAQSYLQPAYVLPMTITANEGLFAGHPVMRSEHFVARAAIRPG